MCVGEGQWDHMCSPGLRVPTWFPVLTHTEPQAFNRQSLKAGISSKLDSIDINEVKHVAARLQPLCLTLPSLSSNYCEHLWIYMKVSTSGDSGENLSHLLSVKSLSLLFLHVSPLNLCYSGLVDTPIIQIIPLYYFLHCLRWIFRF